jgi:hypothetical protein
MAAASCTRRAQRRCVVDQATAQACVLTWRGYLAQVVYSLVDVEDDGDDDAVAAARRGLFAKEAVAEAAAVAALPASLVLTLGRSSLPHKRRLDALAQKRPECGARARRACRHASQR